jgi:hypothetical protein
MTDEEERTRERAACSDMSFAPGEKIMSYSSESSALLAHGTRRGVRMFLAFESDRAMRATMMSCCSELDDDRSLNISYSGGFKINDQL